MAKAVGALRCHVVLGKITGHSFVVNCTVGYLIDGPRNKGIILKEFTLKKDGSEMSDDEINRLVHEKLHFQRIRCVYRWQVKAEAVRNGEVPQYVGDLNPHYSCKKK